MSFNSQLFKLSVYILIFRFDEFGFRIENHNEFSKEYSLADDVYEDPQHRYLLTKLYLQYLLTFIYFLNNLEQLFWWF